MNYWPWGDLRSKRQMDCKIFHMGEAMEGSIPNFPVSSRRPAPDGEVCTWTGPAAAVTSRRQLAGAIQARAPTLFKERLGQRPPPSPRKSERPRCPSSAHMARERKRKGHCWAICSCLGSWSAGPGGAPGPRVRSPALRRATPPDTATSHSRAARSPGPHPPWRPRPHPRLPSGPRRRCRRRPLPFAPGLPRRTCPRLRKRASRVSACLGVGPVPPRALSPELLLTPGIGVARRCRRRRRHLDPGGERVWGKSQRGVSAAEVSHWICSRWPARGRLGPWLTLRRGPGPAPPPLAATRARAGRGRDTWPAQPGHVGGRGPASRAHRPVPSDAGQS